METTMKPDELREVLRSNLRARRLELGLTQKEAAARAGITQPYWTQLETGVRVPQFDLIATLADSLQTTPDALLSRDIFGEVAVPGVDAA